jgi:hypothetical protein
VTCKKEIGKVGGNEGGEKKEDKARGKGKEWNKRRQMEISINCKLCKF